MATLFATTVSVLRVISRVRFRSGESTGLNPPPGNTDPLGLEGRIELLPGLLGGGLFGNPEEPPAPGSTLFPAFPPPCPPMLKVNPLDPSTFSFDRTRARTLACRGGFLHREEVWVQIQW